MTSPLILTANQLRVMATQQFAVSAPLMDEPDLDTNIKKQILCIVGQVSGNVYAAIADMLEAQAKIDPAGTGVAETEIQKKRRLMLERNAQIRQLAAQENWEKFDELTGISPGGDGTSSAPGGDATE